MLRFLLKYPAQVRRSSWNCVQSFDTFRVTSRTRAEQSSIGDQTEQIRATAVLRRVPPRPARALLPRSRDSLHSTRHFFKEFLLMGFRCHLSKMFVRMIRTIVTREWKLADLGRETGYTTLSRKDSGILRFSSSEVFFALC